ncbi:type II restriction endonuclease subunit M [Thauera sinica]|uniref:Type II restriction endonuclease subunit M n=1 Tax=Thauera sinica TaxID=2665146 RepID=A0ABW1AXF6_9RHOO|nr:type II restriction endonuclease subunit M [Thauera sp. K11]
MKAVFLRVNDAPPEERGKALRAVILGLPNQNDQAFKVVLDDLTLIPRSPFVYWIGNGVRSAFSKFPRLDAGQRVAKQGLATADDFRFVRLWPEVGDHTRLETWRPFAKGGSFSPYYSNIYLVVKWERDGLEIASNLNDRGEVKSNIWMLRDTAKNCFFRAGITWPRRPHLLGSFQYLPRGCVFGSDGPAIFSSDVAALAAVLNSAPYLGLLGLLMARGTTGGQTLKYEVGYVTSVPVPTIDGELRDTLAELAKQSWRFQRSLDTRVEISRAFMLPAVLQAGVGSLGDRAQHWARLAAASQAELDALHGQINEESYRLYGISGEDRSVIERGFGLSIDSDMSPDDDDGDESDDDGGAPEVDATPMVASLLSWTLGVAFGRFDVRLATSEREAPPEPEPFDPLPVCSPGMLTGDDDLPVASPPAGYPLTFPTDGILVDDPGHPRDVVRAVRSVFDTVFDDANGCWHEAAELLGTLDLRTWFARDFFEPHIKRYSKSRRKAPIYWQLATASGSYSVWIYIHRATSDTLFQILESSFLGGKLDHEKSKLYALTRDTGGIRSASQRREIEQQEHFVGELQALKTEIARVAPLWKPNLHDGVILNFAPLWRLVPQSRSWQAECKKAWDKLVSGEYDWAHLAMHLWPERVVLKCIDDRSLAIAHGLEEVFWHEDASGSWQKQQVDETTVQKLIDERTSATVKAALKDLLSAATSAVSKGRKPQAKSSSPQSAAPKFVPTIARAPAAEAIVDEATLNVVKAAISRVAGGASKADVLAATGISDADWNKAVTALLDRGDVTRTGQKRGTRYQTKVS